MNTPFIKLVPPESVGGKTLYVSTGGDFFNAQGKRLKPGFSILLTQADRLYVEDQMLPLGRLRESADGSYRANMVVVTKCPKTIQPIEQRLIDTKLALPPSKPLIFTRMRYLPLVPVFEHSALSDSGLSTLSPQDGLSTLPALP